MSDDAQVVKSDPTLERRASLAAKIGIPVATIVGMLIAGKVQGPPLAVLVLAAGTLVGVITALWASLRALLGETPLSAADAFAMAAPRAEEEQKRAVLRALKDLEFERSVGKISEEDYRGLVTHYRGEAKRLLRLLDEEAQPRRDEVEALVRRRLQTEGLLEGTPVEEDAAADDPLVSDKAEKKAKRGKKRKPRPETRSAAVTEEAREDDADDGAKVRRGCASCGTENDGDAVFCKKCGAKQEATS